MADIDAGPAFREAVARLGIKPNSGVFAAASAAALGQATKMALQSEMDEQSAWYRLLALLDPLGSRAADYMTELEVEIGRRWELAKSRNPWAPKYRIIESVTRDVAEGLL